MWLCSNKILITKRGNWFVAIVCNPSHGARHSSRRGSVRSLISRSLSGIYRLIFGERKLKRGLPLCLHYFQPHFYSKVWWSMFLWGREWEPETGVGLQAQSLACRSVRCAAGTGVYETSGQRWMLNYLRTSEKATRKDVSYILGAARVSIWHPWSLYWNMLHCSVLKLEKTVIPTVPGTRWMPNGNNFDTGSYVEAKQNNLYQISH